MRCIVIAYGPPAVTTRALKRAKYQLPLDTEITVVPAHQYALDTLTAAGVVQASDVGTRRLRSVLRTALPEERVLVIHDDVVLTARGTRRLLDAVCAAAPVCVPWSNDLDTDHFLGTLPPARQAMAVLDTLSVPAETSEIQAFRPSVIAGYATAVHDFASDGFVDPRRKIHDPKFLVSVAGVAAAHDGTCGDQMVPIEATYSTPLLVASMIVKNETDFLADCLESMQGVVDRIELCDTGSTDDTVAIATGAGAHVSHFPWNGNFADARNAVLDRCRDARFVLQIDADERVTCTDPVGLRRFLATYGGEYDGFQPLIVNVEKDGSVLSKFRATRMFPATDTFFDGPIHEVPVFRGSNDPIRGANLDLLGLEHLGYTTEVFYGRSKGIRNLEIARQAYEDRPGFRTAYDYGRSLLLEDDGYNPEAARLFDEALEHVEAGNPAAQAYVYGMVASHRLDEQKPEEAIELAGKGLDIVPLEAVAALAHAKACYALGDHDALIELHEWRREARSIAPLYRVERREAEFGSFVAWAYAAAGRLGESYEKLVELIPGHSDTIAHWGDILPAFQEAGLSIAETFGALARMESNGRLIEKAAEVLPASVTAELAAAYAIRGGTSANAIATGLMAGMIGTNTEATQVLAGHADVLDETTLTALAERAIDRGMKDLADLMVAQAG